MVAAVHSGVRRWMPVPVTTSYVVLLLTFGAALGAMSQSVQSQVLFHLSTNLHNLLHGHFATLISSAFVTGAPVWTIVPLLGCVLGFAEIRFGSRRLIEAFLAGHVGATVIVAIGLYVAVNAGWISASVVRAEDVGVSYGAMAVIGAFGAVLPKRWHLPWAVSWLGIGVLGVVLGRTFTNVGHLIALMIGLGLATVMIHKHWVTRTWVKPLSRIERGLLLIASAVGGCFLLG